MNWDKIKSWFDLTASINKVNGIEAVTTIDKNETVFTDPDGNKVIIPGKWGQDVSANGIQAHITCLQAENERLNDEVKRWQDVAGERVETIAKNEKEITDLKQQIKNMSLLAGENNNYDVVMRGLKL